MDFGDFFLARFNTFSASALLFRKWTTTVNPSSAKESAIAWPKLLAEPVITATFFIVQILPKSRLHSKTMTYKTNFTILKS